GLLAHHFIDEAIHRCDAILKLTTTEYLGAVDIPSRQIDPSVAARNGKLYLAWSNSTSSWRIHKITRQSVSGTARDSACASDTRQNLSATQVRQNPADGPLSPRATGAH